MKPRSIAIGAAALVLAVIVVAIVVWPRRIPVAAQTQTVRYGVFETTLPASGVIQNAQTRTLTALVPGNLDHFSVTPGTHVQAGTLLATIANAAVTNAEATTYAAYTGAAARAQSAVATNRVLPAQNHYNVVLAQANLEQARFSENQARADAHAGAQSGLGYGSLSAAEQQSQADAAVAKATTDAREAARLYAADQELYTDKAISRDALDQSQARNDEAQVQLRLARVARTETVAAIGRQAPVLSDRVRAAEDSVRQAQAALAAAQAGAAEPRRSDVEAAEADEAARYADWQFARQQRAELELRAPFTGIVETTATQPGDGTRPLQPGDAIQVGMPLLSLTPDDRFVVRARVDEQDVPLLRIGQRAWIHGVDFGDRRLPAHVVAIDAVAQRSDDPANTSRQLVTTIRLDKTPSFVRPGMTADVDIVVHHQAHVLTIAPAAIRRDAANTPFVFVVRDGVARKATPVLGASNSTAAVVRGGIRSGDVVVTERNDDIVDGTAILGK